MPTKIEARKVAREVKASATSGVVFVHPLESKDELSSVTASLLSANKAVFACGHCDTKIVASAGAAPSCTVCGTGTHSVQASVKISDVNPSTLTAVECSSCKSVSLMETSVVTASAHKVHCSVCGHHNDYSAVAKKIESSSDVTAAKLQHFLTSDGKSTTYSGASQFSFTKAQAIAMKYEGAAIMLLPNNRALVAYLTPAEKDRMKYMDAQGNPVRHAQAHTFKLRQAVAAAGSNTDPKFTPLLIVEGQNAVKVLLYRGGLVKASMEHAVTAAKLQHFLNAEGESTSYSKASQFSLARAQAVAMKYEGSVILMLPNRRALVTYVSPEELNRMKFLNADAEPVSSKQAHTFRLREAAAAAGSNTDPKVTPLIVVDSHNKARVALYRGGLVSASLLKAVESSAEIPMAEDITDEEAADTLKSVESTSDEWPFAKSKTTASATSEPPYNEDDDDEWPFADADNGGNDDEDDEDDVKAGSEDDEGTEEITLEDDLSYLEAAAPPKEDEMSDDLEVELADLDDFDGDIDELADADEMPDNKYVASQDEDEDDLVAAKDCDDDMKMVESSDGEPLVDALEMDDTTAGVSFDEVAGRVVAMKGHVAIASLTPEGAGKNADIMFTPGFYQAAASLAKDAGLRKGLIKAGFSMIKVPVIAKSTLARKVQEATASIQRQEAIKASALSESMAIAAAGLSRGRWKGHENLLLAAFSQELATLGARNPERIAARVLAQSLVPFTKTLLEVTSSINSLSPSARKETAAVLEMTTADALPVEDDADAIESSNDLEQRLQTTAAVLRATHSVVASGSRSARQMEVTAGAHQRAISILEGNTPLMLG